MQPHPDAPGGDFLAFTDAPSPPSEGWRTIRFDAGGLDARRASRLPKIVPHRFLADYDYSIYLDANMRLRGHPDRIIERAGHPDFAAVRHLFRRSVYDEPRRMVKVAKIPPSHQHHSPLVHTCVFERCFRIYSVGNAWYDSARPDSELAE